MSGDVERVQSVLSTWPTPHENDRHRRAIHHATVLSAQHGHAPVLHVLLQSFGDMDASTVMHAFDEAAKNGHANIITTLLRLRRHGRVMVDDDQVQHALAIATTLGRTSVVRALLANVSVDAAWVDFSLPLAVEYNQLDVLRVLMAHQPSRLGVNIAFRKVMDRVRETGTATAESMASLEALLDGQFDAPQPDRHRLSFAYRWALQHAGNDHLARLLKQHI